MDARKEKNRILLLGFVSVLALAFSGLANAKCSIRVADSLITKRYQACSPKKMLSYLYNDLVTPFSFRCAKKLSATCREENCDSPKTTEEKNRCLGTYVSVLNTCEQEIGDAARMALCKDTKTWAVKAFVQSTPSGEVPENATAPVTNDGLLSPSTTGRARSPSSVSQTDKAELSDTIYDSVSHSISVYGPPEMPLFKPKSATTRKDIKNTGI